jgi:hypothetical protein
MTLSQLLDHNITTFLRKQGEMPSGIILHPKGVETLVNEYKALIANADMINIYLRPIKYMGITIYECLDLNENEIKLTLNL